MINNLVKIQENDMGNKKTSTSAFTQKEIDEVRKHLEDAMEVFYKDKSEESLTKVLEKLTSAALFGMDLHVPVDIEDGAMTFHLENVVTYGWVYVACTTKEQFENGPALDAVGMTTKKLLQYVAEDPEIAGLIINPYHEPSPDVLVFFKKENVIDILNMVDDLIKHMPEQLQAKFKQVDVN